MQTLANGPSVLGIPLVARGPADHESAADEAVPEVFRVTRPDLVVATSRVSGAAAVAGARVRATPAATRRRVVLGVLVGVLAVVAGLVVAGILLPVALAAPAALIVGFLGIARHQVRTARARRAQQGRRVEAPGATAAAPAARRPVPGASGATWEPRPTTLPTYVTAPPASGFPRVIDTETPGAWTAAAMLERAQQEKMRAERMAAAKAEAIARAKAEQAAAEARTRDEEFLAAQAAEWERRAANEATYRRRAVNE
jgi:hypothetical protein